MLRKHHIGSDSGEYHFIMLHITKIKLSPISFSVFLFFIRAKAVNNVTGEHRILLLGAAFLGIGSMLVSL